MGRRTRVREACPSPDLKARGGHSFRGCPGGKEGHQPRLPGAGLAQGPVLPVFQEPEGNQGPGASPAQRVARPSWVFGRLGNSSKR